jgi:glycine hydroxymethyltransferase
LRLGTLAVTTQGLTEADMATVADLIVRAIEGTDPAAVAEEVAALTFRYPLYRSQPVMAGLDGASSAP